MRTPKSFLAALAAGLLIGAGAAPVVQAADAPDEESAEQAQFVGDPIVRFRGKQFVAIVRMDRAIPKGVGGTSMVIGPKVRVGDRIEYRDRFGFQGAGSIGDSSRFCYLLAPARVRGVPTPRAGQRWRLGVMGQDDDRVVSLTKRVTLRPVTDNDQIGDSRKLGCWPSKKGKGRLVGKTVRVTAKEAEVWAKPPDQKVYAGLVKLGDRFHVKRLSPSGKYAFGRSFRHKRDVYIATSALR